MVFPEGQPSEFWAGVVEFVVLGVDAFDGVLEDPQAVKAPTAMIKSTASARTG
jgi:hypothetical protein